MSSSLLRKFVAEFIGTFALVFVGCGSVMVNVVTGGSLGHMGVCASFGLVIMVMIYATGHISGAHFNPAVSVAFASIGRFRWSEVGPYVVAQCVGATVAAFILAGALGEVANIGGTSLHISWVASAVVEFLLTFFLMFVITAVATDARAEGAMAGLAIGGTVAMAALMGGPLTGASMNPARSLGPAMVVGPGLDLALYCIVPVIGAIAGAHAYRWTQDCSDEEPGSEAGGCC